MTLSGQNKWQLADVGICKRRYFGGMVMIWWVLTAYRPSSSAPPRCWAVLLSSSSLSLSRTLLSPSSPPYSRVTGKVPATRVLLTPLPSLHFATFLLCTSLPVPPNAFLSDGSFSLVSPRHLSLPPALMHPSDNLASLNSVSFLWDAVQSLFPAAFLLAVVAGQLHRSRAAVVHSHPALLTA